MGVNMSIETMREFFGWCSVINIGVLFFTTVMIIALRGVVVRVHEKMFNLEEQSLSKIYLQYLAQYKIAAIVFCVVPYFTLRIMG
jgi:hypothetical protein